MKYYVVMPMRSYDSISGFVEHALNILELGRLTKKGKLEVINSLVAIRDELREDLTKEEV